jgi:branched-chain amino acid transport system substrate-binding protein
MGYRGTSRRLLIVLIAAAAIAAACGGDNSGGGAAATTAAGATTTAAGATTAAAGATTTTAAAGGSTTTGGAATSAAGGGAAGDSTDGKGASAWEAALKATESKHLKADSSKKPFVIGMPNLEGDPAGTFPDVHDGANAAVKLINDRLGGIGADVAAGKAGRPIKLEYCGHVVNQDEAQKCANQVASAKPNVVQIGVDFFSPLMYPLFKDTAVVETLPIFIADFDQPGVVSAFGGCPTAFPSSAQMIAEVKKHDKLAVIWAQNAPGTECWTDTQERFYKYETTNAQGFQFQGFPYNPGETAGYPAVIQQVANYLKGAKSPAVYYGIQATDCAAFLKGLRGGGVTGQIYEADSCSSDAVFNLSESHGIEQELQGYVRGQPDLYSSLVAYELDQREKAIQDASPKAPLSNYTRQSFSGIVWIYQVANDMLASGGNIDDAAALRTAFGSVDNFHVVGYRPVSCKNNPAEYESVCAHTATYATWDGSKFTVDTAIPNKGVIDVRDLMNKVEKASPRKTS